MKNRTGEKGKRGRGEWGSRSPLLLFSSAPLLLLLLLFPASAANLIHNGSFEIGPSGWNEWGNQSVDSFGLSMALASRVVSSNNAYVHGGRSLYFEGRAVSPPFMCTAGQTNTLTGSIRTDSSKAFSMAIMPTYRVTGDPGQDKDGNNVPAYQFTATSAWQRFTNQYVALTNGMHVVKIYQSGANMWVDAVQVETGSVASAFAPASPVEVGMDTPDQANVLFLGDTKQLRFNFWNDPGISATTNVISHYNLTDVWNTNIITGAGDVSTNSMVTGRTTINLNLPALWGSIRATCYVTNLNHTWDETVVTTLPYAAQSGKNPNGLLGLHPNWSMYHLNDVRRLGFSHGRILSPTSDARWTNIFPTLTTTQMNAQGVWYTDVVISNFCQSDLIPIIVLAPEDNRWRQPAETNASWAVMRNDFTNYPGRLGTRYKGGAAYSNMIWEVFNEPQQTPREAVAMYDPVYYSDLYTNVAALLKSIDPNFIVIALGGLSQSQQGTNFWSYISPAGKANAEIISVHFYPQNSGANDPNASDDLGLYSTANYNDWRREFGATTNKTWNTENATRDAGAFHTDLVAFMYPYWFDNIDGFGGNQAWYQELDCRGHVPAVDRATYNFCRSIGSGMSHFNLQYGRNVNEVNFQINTPSIYELNGTIKPWTAALLIANNFIQVPGSGRITNVNEYFVECWGHQGTTRGSVATIWCPDKGGRTLTFTNTPALAQFDTMGNLIKTNPTTINIGRSITYLVSGTMNYGLFRTNIENATVATNADTTAPGLTADVSPIGTVTAWGGVSNLFKATAIDESVSTYGASGVQVTNVYYRWTLDDGVTWSPWAVTNVFLYSFSAANIYRVGWQAKDKAGNTSPTVYTPYFGDLSYAPYVPPPVVVGPRLRIGGRRLKVTR